MGARIKAQLRLFTERLESLRIDISLAIDVAEEILQRLRWERQRGYAALLEW